MALKIIVVGAGIAGLVVATSLRQSGHTVVVLEKYALSEVEVGAAVNVAPNGARVLAHLGFIERRARACRPLSFDVLRGTDMKELNSMPYAKMPGHPEPGTLTIHRADLHRELLRIATADDGKENASWGPPLDIRPGSAVRHVSGDGAGVLLESGEEVHGDLIIGSDGMHSVVRDFVTQESGKAVHSGMAAFRFLLESDQLRADPELASLLEMSKDHIKLLADTTDMSKERHMVFYACQDGDTQNFVGIHPSTSTTTDDASEELKTAMKTEFSHFDPRIEKVIDLSSHIKRWPLIIHDPLPTWTRGCVVLIGDAAHPMLPFGGQGANQAMEDGAALGVLLKNRDKREIEGVLRSFEAIRKNRTARVQILSSVRVGREGEVTDRLQPYLDGAVPKAPTSTPQRVLHDFSYDVYAACEKSLML